MRTPNRLEFTPYKRSLTCRLKMVEQEVLLAKPQTYMNDSGRAIVALASYYKIPIENVLIAYDELDLDVGRAQLRFGGGHGGHNGMRDIVHCIGKDFWRLRLGIGHPGQGRRDEVSAKSPPYPCLQRGCLAHCAVHRARLLSQEETS